MALPTRLASALQARQLPALDGIRAIAAFLVVFYHCGSPLIPGGLGVLIFLVLSGFLITWLLFEEQDRHGKISLRDFYIRRTLRIFPAFYVYWLIMVVRTASTGKIVWPQAISSFFYVNNYYQAIFGDPNTGLSHTWSLGVEEQFYLLWPLSFLWLMRQPRSLAMRVLMIVIGAIWVYRGILHLAGVWQGYAYEAFEARADHLLIGCLLAFSLRSGIGQQIWQLLSSSAAYSWLIVGLLVGSVALENHYGTTYRNLLGFVINPVLVALLIPLAMMEREGSWQWLGWGWIRQLGRLSYSVYLYQQLTPGLIAKVLHEERNWALFVAANTVLVILMAAASFYCVERPFLHWKERFSKR